MANEIRVMAGLTIQKRDADTNEMLLEYQNRPTAFNDDMTGTKGPTPGALTIPTGGKIIPLDELDTIGWCWLWNMDATNYVEWGVYDVDRDEFTPVGEIPARKGTLIYLSRNFREGYVSTGTGTTSESTKRLFMKANTADVNVRVEAFER